MHDTDPGEARMGHTVPHTAPIPATLGSIPHAARVPDQLKQHWIRYAGAGGGEGHPWAQSSLAQWAR